MDQKQPLETLLQKGDQKKDLLDQRLGCDWNHLPLLMFELLT